MDVNLREVIQLANRVMRAKGQSFAMLQREYQNLTLGQTIHQWWTSLSP